MSARCMTSRPSQSLYAFPYTVPVETTRGPASSSPAAAKRGRFGGSFRERIVRLGDTSLDGMREKLRFVMAEMKLRLDGARLRLAGCALTQAYTVHDIGPLVRRRDRAARARRGRSRLALLPSAGGRHRLRDGCTRRGARTGARPEANASKPMTNGRTPGAPTWRQAEPPPAISSRQALERIADPSGEGPRAFTQVDADRRALDGRRVGCTAPHAAIVRSPIEGLPVSVKDLFDVAGQVTRAGSALLADAAPAERRCRGRRAAARRRRRPHRAHQHGRVRLRRRRAQPAHRHAAQPVGPRARAACRAAPPRAPAVAQADGMSVMALGSRHARLGAHPGRAVRRGRLQADARGACRRDGAFPLSWTLDSVGPLADSVACCAIVRRNPRRQQRRPRSCRWRSAACACWYRRAA